MMGRKLFLVVTSSLLAGTVIGASVDRVAFAQQPGSGIKRTILQTVDAPGNPNYQAVMAVSELAPNATSGRHRHPGVELCYLLDGSFTLLREGQPSVTLKQGDSCVNEGAGWHEARNTGTTTAKALAVYIVEKGKPVAEAVP